MNETSVDPLEVAKFAQHAQAWWDKEGSFKTLHDINQIRLNFVQDHVDIVGQTVLDIGCGGGILSESMVRAGAVVTGLDAEKDAIEVAHRHAQDHHVTLTYVCEPVETYLQGEQDQFDAITCMELLEHVPSPQLIIHHAARLLKPNGVLFLSTINRTLTAYVTAILGAEYVLNIIPRQTHDYDKFIKPSELSAMVREAGLEPEVITGLSYNPFTRQASLQKSVSVNYLLVCRKSLL